MKLIALDCNHCGAPLEVPPKLRSVTCAFCKTKLAIRHEGSAIYTEVVEQIASGVETLIKQNELERLDREWAMRREQFAIHNDDGSVQMPNKAAGVIMIVGGVVFGLIALVASATVRGFGQFGIVVLVVVALAVFTGIRAMAKGERFEREREAYHRERRELMHDLES